MILAILGGSSTAAIAATGAEATGESVLFHCFLVFGAAIIGFQALPGLVMFVGMLRGLCSPAARREADVEAGRQERQG